MGEPLVSVIMPIYNGAKFVSQSIESILNQSYAHFEFIIIDDCSTDDSLDIIKRYCDERIKLYINDTNKGIAYTTNRGIENAVGKYIALLDDDDIAYKERLQLQVQYMEENDDIDILGGRADIIDENGIMISPGTIPRNNPLYIKAMLLFNNLDFSNCTTFIRRQFLIDNNLLYEENCYGMQDYLMNIKASKCGKISSLENCIASRRIRSDNAGKIIERIYKNEQDDAYASFRELSLKVSGYELSSDDMTILNKAMKQGNEGVSDIREWIRIVKIMERILTQAKEMQVEYEEELNIVVKKKLIALLQTINFIEEINSIYQ